MNWKPWGKDDQAELSSDGVYWIHHSARGWDAWRRLPHLTRLGKGIALATTARQICENDQRAQEQSR